MATQSRSKSGKFDSSKILRKVHSLEENKQRNKEVEKGRNSFYAVLCIYGSYFAESLKKKTVSKRHLAVHSRYTYLFGEIHIIYLIL